MAIPNRIAGHKGRITVLEGKLKATAPGDSQISLLVDQIQKQVRIIGGLYDELIQKETDPALVEQHITDQSDYDMKVQGLINNYTTNQIGVKQNNLPVKLPVIELPTFCGDATNWNEFWEQYNTLVHDRTDLDDVTKFHYLRNALKDQASKLIANFSTTSVNYRAAVDLLRTTYNVPGRGIREISKRLLNIKSPNHNAKELLNFRAELESDLRSLEGLGCNVQDSGWLIVTILTEKLNFKTVEQVNFKAQSDYPTLNEFRDGLNAVINQLAALESTKTPKSEKDKGKSNSKWYQQSTWNPTQIGQYAVGTEDSQKSHSEVKACSDKSVIQTTVSQTSEKPSERSKATKPKLECLFCKNSHPSINCSVHASIQARKSRLITLGKCDNCCRKKDTDHVCQLGTCPKCKESVHHSFLCPKAETKTHVCLVNTNVKKSKTTLPVATFQILKNKRKSVVRTLLDTGSQRTFVKDTVAKRLNLQPVGKVNLKVAGFLGESGYVDYDAVNLTVKVGRRFTKVQALVTSKLPVNVQVLGLTKATEHLKQKVRLMDPNVQSDEVHDLEMLCGADYYFRIISGHARIDGIDLLKSAAGYIIAGNIPEKFQPTSVVSQNIAIVAKIGVDEVSFERNVVKLWELDAIGIKPDCSTPEERVTVENFQNTVQFHSGQYWTRLPWKATHPPLPTNYNLALTRTKYTYDQLKKQKGHLEQYDQIIQTQLQAGFIEEVVDPVVHEKSHYLTHLRVLRDSTTTPMRMVFDCSAKIKGGVSLNDCLLKGPSFVETLGKVLLRFRTNKYSYTSDISKAFLRIGLQEEDRDFTRFLWPSDLHDFQSPMKTYRFKSVLFGATSSPFLLQATIHHHFNSQYPHHEFSDTLKESLYVDNIQGTCDDESTLIRLYKTANQIFQEANLPLQQWRSNSPILNQMIRHDYPTEEISNDAKLLGMHWDVQNDTLSLSRVEWSPVQTKRQLLSECSKVFDPLGLITPVTIALKILIQKAWVNELEWDQPLPQQMQEEYQKLVENVGEVQSLKFPRKACEEGKEYQLHVFSDASTKAYGAVAYLLTPGEVPQILTSKARVAPIKSKTLPQLELTAVLVAARLACYIQTTLKHISLSNIYLWTDSEITLSWVLNNKSETAYVRNRVSEILELVPTAKFLYVNTKQNPADLLTRGVGMNTLNKSRVWFNGPEWLQQKDQWPEQKYSEIMSNVISCDPPETVIDCTRYSTLNKLVKVVKTVLRARDKFLKRCPKSVTELTADAIKILVKMVQHTEFTEVYRYLSRTNNYSKVPEIVKTLSLYLEDGIIRCLGRLGRAELSSCTKFPMLLPKKHTLTNLIIDRCHQRALHGGVQETLNDLRTEFWVPQGRQQVKLRIKTCQVCKIVQGRNYKLPPSPPLPVERVISTRPFSVVGIDYTGAITISKDTVEPVKVYICLFTCAITRAVHLELVEDLTAETFLLAFRRFIARRSCPSVIISDNATNFKASAGFLHQFCVDPGVNRELETRNIHWKFITPRSPWQGGFYERLIGIVKGCLRKVLFRRKINISELATVLTEVEARVNNRPLTYMNEFPDKLETITPSHLLCGHKLQLSPIVPAEDVSDIDYQGTFGKINERYSYIQRLIKRWQDIWAKEYLTSLREKQFGSRDPSRKFEQTIKVGDIVLVHSETPRDMWPLAKILELYPDDKGMIRVVKVKTQQGEMIRSIKFLYPLEQGPKEEDQTESVWSDRDGDHQTVRPVSDDESEIAHSDEVRSMDRQDQTIRVTRRAADRCRDWLRGVCADEGDESEDSN